MRKRYVANPCAGSFILAIVWPVQAPGTGRNALSCGDDSAGGTNNLQWNSQAPFNRTMEESDTWLKSRKPSRASGPAWTKAMGHSNAANRTTARNRKAPQTRRRPTSRNQKRNAKARGPNLARHLPSKRQDRCPGQGPGQGCGLATHYPRLRDVGSPASTCMGPVVSPRMNCCTIGSVEFLIWSGVPTVRTRP